jgi:hypothetical protein
MSAFSQPRTLTMLLDGGGRLLLRRDLGVALLVLPLLVPEHTTARDTRCTVRFGGRSLFRVNTSEDLRGAFSGRPGEPTAR